jgi:hypothetical protein
MQDGALDLAIEVGWRKIGEIQTYLHELGLEFVFYVDTREAWSGAAAGIPPA